MHSQSAPNSYIRLEPLAGPPGDVFEIHHDRPYTMGRSTGCDAQLADKTVSRRHCRITYSSDNWFITDLESRHGTYVNGAQLDVNTPTMLSEGDLIRMGPWTYRARMTEAAPSTLPTANDVDTSAHRVQKVPERELARLAQQRLDLLIQCAATISGAASEASLAEAMLDAVAEGTGFSRAAIIRESGPDVEIIAYRSPTQRDAPSQELMFSRSLINAAKSGMVRMTSDSQQNFGQSIMDLGIHSALCAPIVVDGTVNAFLYLDARRQESKVQSDAAAFCQAVCKMGGTSWENLKRKRSEHQNAELLRDVRAAGAAQKLLMPPPHGQIETFAYFMRMRPGRLVAGDLFSIMALPDGRVAAFLGDVAGKGSAASIHMAVTLTLLKEKLEATGDPAQALNLVNRQVTPLLPPGKFISLWCGVFDESKGSMVFVDAGHGHWLYRSGHYAPQTIKSEGGMPIGVDPDVLYATDERPFATGSRVILFSDGVVEQQSPEGEEFGIDRVIETIRQADSTDTEVNGLFQAVRDFAATENLNDDVTVASIERRSR
ncbi:MAG: SpoIIE family protein phosphatase [Salinibacterium sp.]|nr:SpoIIE family protein phosphatase [Salinibacterium sp.]